jgi:hypothetical protein
LTNIVPDVLLWYNQNAHTYTNGPVDIAAQEANLGNWEPYISVLGDSTFLIGANTFADDQTAPAAATATAPFQRFVVTFQTATGGSPKIGDEFFTDAGAPFRSVINLSRENGNPQRVAGDKRVGATNFLSAAETSAGQLAAFQNGSRWTTNVIYQADNRYVTVQPFSLNVSNLTQTALHPAFDAVYGQFVSTTAPSGAPQVSRTGGTVAGLDNGNFVVVIDDKTSYSDPGGEVTTFAIITPSGSVVRTNTLVDPRDIWDNVAAYKGGFAVRVHDMLYFYDNNGSLQHTNNLIDSSSLPFGTGREDSSRIGGDIRSPYVYLAGQTPETGKSDPVNIAIWDSRTGQFVTSATVTDTDTNSVQALDRVVVAVDALDRFCVAYQIEPSANFTAPQVAARVGKLVGTNVTFYGHSFFPFVNYDNDGTKGITTVNANVAMTTRAICLAAKGTVNSTNSPAGGANTAPETTLYTVISHPDPQPAAGGATISITGRSTNSITLTFTGALQSADAVTGPWAAMSGNSPLTVPIAGAAKFFRVQ